MLTEEAMAWAESAGHRGKLDASLNIFPLSTKAILTIPMFGIRNGKNWGTAMLREIKKLLPRLCRSWTVCSGPVRYALRYIQRLFEKEQEGGKYRYDQYKPAVHGFGNVPDDPDAYDCTQCDHGQHAQVQHQ
jgi:hypothetical protein